MFRENEEYIGKKNEKISQKKDHIYESHSKNLFSFIKNLLNSHCSAARTFIQMGPSNKSLPSIICFKASNNHSYNHSLLLQPICVLLLYSIPPMLWRSHAISSSKKKKVQIDIKCKIYFWTDFDVSVEHLWVIKSYENKW